MRFKTLFAVCALFGSLFQSSPSLSETLRTAWLGEHEAFLTWYAKEKGWDKEAGLDIIMLRFDSGKSLIENVRAYDWAIAGCGAVPAMQATMSDQVEVMQRYLATLGYLSTTPDGQFGSGTERAVKLFQEANGLKADGVVLR